ncbi:unnamed protein product, partial [Cyprideis torosa]
YTRDISNWRMENWTTNFDMSLFQTPPAEGQYCSVLDVGTSEIRAVSCDQSHPPLCRRGQGATNRVFNGEECFILMTSPLPLDEAAEMCYAEFASPISEVKSRSALDALLNAMSIGGYVSIRVANNILNDPAALSFNFAEISSFNGSTSQWKFYDNSIVEDNLQISSNIPSHSPSTPKPGLAIYYDAVLNMTGLTTVDPREPYPYLCSATKTQTKPFPLLWASDKTCYALIKESVTYDEAMSSCRDDYGGTLAELNSLTKIQSVQGKMGLNFSSSAQLYLRNTIRNNPYAQQFNMTGVLKGVESHFFRFSDGTSIPQTFFGDTSGGGVDNFQDCLTLSTQIPNVVQTTSCSNTMDGFVCQLLTSGECKSTPPFIGPEFPLVQDVALPAPEESVVRYGCACGYSDSPYIATCKHGAWQLESQGAHCASEGRVGKNETTMALLPVPLI